MVWPQDISRDITKSTNINTRCTVLLDLVPDCSRFRVVVSHLASRKQRKRERESESIFGKNITSKRFWQINNRRNKKINEDAKKRQVSNISFRYNQYKYAHYISICFYLHVVVIVAHCCRAFRIDVVVAVQPVGFDGIVDVVFV